MLLKDKVVIVSGIGPGLGIELALLAAQEGAKLAICARTPSKLDEAERDVAALGLGTEVLKVPTDIADREQCRNLVDRTIERFGRVDVLINSAYVGGSFEPIETRRPGRLARHHGHQLLRHHEAHAGSHPAHEAPGRWLDRDDQHHGHARTHAHAGRLRRLQGRVARRDLAPRQGAGQVRHPGELDVHGLDVGPAGRERT